MVEIKLVISHAFTQSSGPKETVIFGVYVAANVRHSGGPEDRVDPVNEGKLTNFLSAACWLAGNHVGAIVGGLMDVVFIVFSPVGIELDSSRNESHSGFFGGGRKTEKGFHLPFRR